MVSSHLQIHRAVALLLTLHARSRLALVHPVPDSTVPLSLAQDNLCWVANVCRARGQAGKETLEALQGASGSSDSCHWRYWIYILQFV